MDHRERFLNTMRFKNVDRIPLRPAHIGIWPETATRWISEGLPPEMNVREYIGNEPMLQMDIYFGFCPAFETVVMEEEGETRVLINHEGIRMRELKDNPRASMPQFLEFPVKNRKDFEKLKYRLQLNEKDRFPEDWKEKCDSWKNRNAPLVMDADRQGGFFGPLRNLMGLENLLFTYYDDPALIEMMVENRVELMLGILGKIFKDTGMDMFVFWEDMCFNHGPLLSPELFKKYMSPAYRKITDYLRSNGVDIIFVDSDGRIDKLIPLWLEAGVNGILPMEVQSGMDVASLRKQYGRDLLMIGGIDKRALSRGKKDIEQEMDRIAPIIEKGGYLPGLDHSIPPDVSLENFEYYRDMLAKAVGMSF